MDTTHTFIVDQFAPLDLILFNRLSDAFAAHVGICLRSDAVLHLSRRVGTPAIWNRAAFVSISAIAVVIGAKRTHK